jgi:hypothetical protein
MDTLKSIKDVSNPQNIRKSAEEELGSISE